MISALEIVNLFELVRNCSIEDWTYNKQRLIEIIEEYDEFKKEQTIENYMENILLNH